MVAPRNVILFSVDALRADHVSCYGYSRETSPFLDELADRGACFLNAFSASSHTREAIPALLTGKYPNQFAQNGYRLVGESIATKLSESGFQTAAFHSNPYVSRAYGYERGFDTFYDDLTFGKNRFVALAERALNKFVLNKGNYHARASEINTRSLNWIDSLDDDDQFFLWNHYMDVHGPYNPPEKYSVYADRSVSNSEAQTLYQKSIDQPEVITDDERDLLIDFYDGEIKYLDAQLRKFFEALSSRNLLEDSLVIVTSDHGDAFGEHGYYTHPRQLNDQLLAVPLLMFGADISPGYIETSASTLDIAPTVLRAVGANVESLPGGTLVSLMEAQEEDRPRTVISSTQGENETAGIRRFAAQEGRFKYMFERNIKTGKVSNQQIFDHDSDPKEQDPISFQSPPERVVKLRSELIAHSEQVFSNSEILTQDQDVATREVEQRLEHLGYK